MFKLLTETAEKKVRHEYFIRRAIVILCALILVLIVGIVGLLPSYLLSYTRLSEVSAHTEMVKTVKLSGDEQDLKIWLAKINQRLATMSPALDMDRPWKFVNMILGQQGSDINLTGFFWLKEKLGKKKVTTILLSISGVARDRQALIAFKERISALKYFSNVVSPISELARDRDILFEITFSPANASSLETIP